MKDSTGSALPRLANNALASACSCATGSALFLEELPHLGREVVLAETEGTLVIRLQNHGVLDRHRDAGRPRSRGAPCPGRMHHQRCQAFAEALRPHVVRRLLLLGGGPGTHLEDETVTDADDDPWRTLGVVKARLPQRLVLLLGVVDPPHVPYGLPGHGGVPAGARHGRVHFF